MDSTEEFIEFAAAVGPRLRRTAYLLCGDWHAAQDLTQTALAKVFVAWHRINSGRRQRAGPGGRLRARAGHAAAAHDAPGSPGGGRPEMGMDMPGSFVARPGRCSWQRRRP